MWAQDQENCERCCAVFRAHREVFQNLAHYRMLYSVQAASVFCLLSGVFALVAFEYFAFLCSSHTTYWTNSSVCTFPQFNISSFPTPLLPVSLTYESQPQSSFLLRPHAVSTMIELLKPLNDGSLSFSLKTYSLIALVAVINFLWRLTGLSFLFPQLLRSGENVLWHVKHGQVYFCNSWLRETILGGGYIYWSTYRWFQENFSHN